MTEVLQSNLLISVFEFLSLKDFRSLTLTCKLFSDIIANHNKFWARECLNRYLSFDLELYSEAYDSEDYKSCIQKKVPHLPKGLWKQLLEEGETQRQAFLSVLTQISSSEEAEDFIRCFFETLKQPNLPMANLKRETIMCVTQTLFQAKLSEVLYEDSGLIGKKVSFPDSNQSLIDALQIQQDKIHQEMLFHDKSEILKARWYNFDKENLDSDDTISFEDRCEISLEMPAFLDVAKLSNASTEDIYAAKSKASLMSLYESLCNTLTHNCKVIHKYLTSLDDSHLLLTEYTARWKIYVCAILELERIFTTFTNLVNENYEVLFEGYPCFPKFSIWRLMTKLWMKEVYEKLSLNRSLNEAFLETLSSLRENNAKEAFKQNTHMSNQSEDEFMELPKSLYINLKIRENQQLANFGQGFESQDSFDKSIKLSQDSEVELLSSFLQSMVDISVNEVSVHYLDCTDIPTNYPYKELEEAILTQTCGFNEEYKQILRESPEYFCQFLKADQQLLSRILVPKASAKFDQIQTQNGIQVMKEFIMQKLDEIDPIQLQKCTNQFTTTNDQGDDLNELMESVVKSAIQEKSFCQMSEISTQDSEGKKEMFIEEDSQEHEPKNCINKTSIKVIVTALESASPHFKLNFRYFKEGLERLQFVEENNQTIKLTNTDKNIPYEMGDVDCLFYDLDKNVNINILEKLYEDYQTAKKQQDEEEEDLPDLQILGNPTESGQNDLRDLGNGLEFGGDFSSDFDNLDLMNLPETMLRRAII